MKKAEFAPFAFFGRDAPEDAAPEAESATILVCEDDPALRLVIDFMLSDSGYRVLTAAGGEEALRLAETVDEVDVLVTDVGMPQMSGPELIRALRSRFPALEVLVISGYPADAVPGVDPAEGYAFLRKPFDDDSLRSAIEDLLRCSGQRDAPT